MRVDLRRPLAGAQTGSRARVIAAAARQACTPPSRARHARPPSRRGRRASAPAGLPRGYAMLDRLGLPRPQIATKLYGAIALTLAVVYVLAAATIHFAGRTDDAVGTVREDALQSRRGSRRPRDPRWSSSAELVASAPSRWRRRCRAARRARLRRSSTRRSPRCWRAWAPRHERKLAKQFADLAQLGASVLGARARRSAREQASAAAAEYAAAARGPAARRRRRAPAAHRARREAALDSIAASSRTLIAWVCAAAAVTGLLIGPVGPAAAAPRAGAPAGHRLGAASGSPATTPRSTSPGLTTRTRSASSPARWPSSRPSRSSCCRRRASSSASTCSSMPPSTTCRWG